MNAQELSAILNCRLEDVLQGAKLAEGDIRRITTVVTEEGKTTVQVEETMQFTRTSDDETLRGRLKIMIDALAERLRRPAGTTGGAQEWQVRQHASGTAEPESHPHVLSTNRGGVRDTA